MWMSGPLQGEQLEARGLADAELLQGRLQQAVVLEQACAWHASCRLLRIY